jgi:hypothetical protein
MTTNRENIIKKIRDLIARATHNSANIHEAESCAAKARELMEKYKIDNVNLQEVDPIGQVRAGKKTAVKWQTLLYRYIATAFDLQPVQHKDSILFIGETLNAEIGSYLYDQLRVKIQKLTNEYGKQIVKDLIKADPRMGHPVHKARLDREKREQMRGFAIGAAISVGKRLLNQKEAEPTSTQKAEGLVKVETRIAAYMQQNFPKIRVIQSKSRKANSDALAAGTMAGENIQINKGVAGSAGSQKLLN